MKKLNFSYNIFRYFILTLGLLLSTSNSFADDYSFITPNAMNACQLISEDLPNGDLQESTGLALNLEPNNQTTFLNLIDQVRYIYSPLLKKHDLDVMWTINWESQVENAFAAPNGGGGKRELKLYGGLYRHALISADGYLFVLCHELGHVMGGAPFHAYFPELSAEGQADYYSTNTCLPIIFANQDNISAIKKLNVPLSVKLDCDRVWKTPEDSAICQRSIMAAFSFSKFLMRALNGAQVSFTKHDSEKVEATKEAWYPEKQCRFDTSMAGALCAKKINSTQEVGEPANCSLYNLIASKAARPQCWFKTPGM